MSHTNALMVATPRMKPQTFPDYQEDLDRHRFGARMLIASLPCPTCGELAEWDYDMERVYPIITCRGCKNGS